MGFSFLLAVLMLPASSVLAVPVQAAPLSTDDLRTIASTTAQAYHLNIAHFMATIQCESAFNPSATSTTDDFGIAQINATAHPEITRAEMLDPQWSLIWMANMWQAGNASAWTCWRELYSSS